MTASNQDAQALHAWRNEFVVRLFEKQAECLGAITLTQENAVRAMVWDALTQSAPQASPAPSEGLTNSAVRLRNRLDVEFNLSANLRRVIERWNAKAAELGYEGVAHALAAAPPLAPEAPMSPQEQRAAGESLYAIWEASKATAAPLQAEPETSGNAEGDTSDFQPGSPTFDGADAWNAQPVTKWHAALDSLETGWPLRRTHAALRAFEESHKAESAAPESGNAESAPCPFCGSDNVSDGEALTEEPSGKVYTQSECQGCGALGPQAHLHRGEIDYGSAKAIAAWNRRATTATPAAREAESGDRNMEGASEFITALLLGRQVWPNTWGQDVAAAAFFVHNQRLAAPQTQPSAPTQGAA